MAEQVGACPSLSLSIFLSSPCPRRSALISFWSYSVDDAGCQYLEGYFGGEYFFSVFGIFFDVCFCFLLFCFSLFFLLL